MLYCTHEKTMTIKQFVFHYSMFVPCGWTTKRTKEEITKSRTTEKKQLYTDLSMSTVSNWRCDNTAL